MKTNVIWEWNLVEEAQVCWSVVMWSEWGGLMMTSVEDSVSLQTTTIQLFNHSTIQLFNCYIFQNYSNIKWLVKNLLKQCCLMKVNAVTLTMIYWCNRGLVWSSLISPDKEILWRVKTRLHLKGFRESNKDIGSEASLILIVQQIMWLFSRETSSLVFIVQSTRNGRGKSQISNWGRNHYFCSRCSKQRLNCVDLLRNLFVYHQVHLYDLSGGEVKQRSSELFGRCVEGVWQSTVVVYGREYCFTRHGVTSIIPVSYILWLVWRHLPSKYSYVYYNFHHSKI